MGEHLPKIIIRGKMKSLADNYSILSNHIHKRKQSCLSFRFRIEPINEFELAVLSLLVILLFVAMALLNNNIDAYRAFVKEDGIIEWLTVVALFFCADVCLKRTFRLKSLRDKRFRLFLFLASLLFLFGVGEEISWGQRIFGIESSNFFMNYNSQQETNIHNLIFQNIRINKVVFSFFLGGVIAAYLLILPIFYKKKAGVKKFINSIALPIPRSYHITSYVVFTLIINMLHAPDKWELLEMTGACIFFLIILNPLNREIFIPHKVDLTHE